MQQQKNGTFCPVLVSDPCSEVHRVAHLLSGLFVDYYMQVHLMFTYIHITLVFSRFTRRPCLFYSCNVLCSPPCYLPQLLGRQHNQVHHHNKKWSAQVTSLSKAFQTLFLQLSNYMLTLHLIYIYVYIYIYRYI